MTFSTFVDHDQKLVLFRAHGEITQSDLERVLTLFRRPDFPAAYDIVTVFDADVHTRLDYSVLVPHAIERQRTLIEIAPVRAIRSAIIAVPERLESILELWPAFFPDSDNHLVVKIFDAEQEAFDWLERKPVDPDTLPAFCDQTRMTPS